MFNWADSFCSRMVEELRPQVAPSARDIPADLEAPIGQQVTIGSYIGVPVTREDGTLFGTLCAIDPLPKNNDICDDLPTIQLLERLFGSLLTRELKDLERLRLLEKSQHQAVTDELSGLLNRRGWEQVIAREETRARRYGLAACVLSIDLDDLKKINDSQGHASGDDLIRRTARCLVKGGAGLLM